MTDRIEKALRKLSSKERQKLSVILEDIRNKKLSRLDLKKLKGRDEIYRVRKGNMRVIFKMAGDEVYILAVERRSDTTYNRMRTDFFT